MELKGKVALIPGSTSGIGAESSTLFAAEGAGAITGRQPAVGERLVRDIDSTMAADGGRTAI